MFSQRDHGLFLRDVGAKEGVPFGTRSERIGLHPNGRAQHQHSIVFFVTNVPVLVKPQESHPNPAKVYLSCLAKSGRPAAEALIRGVAKMLGANSLDAVPWNMLRCEHVVALKAKALELGKSPATVNSILTRIRGIVRSAWNMGLISAEDVARIEAVKGVKAVMVPLGRRVTSGELRAIMSGINTETASGKRDAGIIALAYCVGLQRRELANLRLGDVTDKGDEIEITVKGGEGRKARVLFLNNGGADALRDYLSVRMSSPGSLFWSCLKGGKLVPGSSITHQAVYARIRWCANKAGVKGLTPRDMRQSFVSDMLDAGVNISTVAAMAGHASVSTTQRYDRKGNEAKKKATKALPLTYRR